MTQTRYIGHNLQTFALNLDSQVVSGESNRFTKVVNFGVVNPLTETETGGLNVTGWLTSTRSPTNPSHVPNKAFTDLTYLAKSDRTNKLMSEPVASSIIRITGTATEVIPLTDFGKDVVSYTTPEALSTAKKIPLVDKQNIFTLQNQFLKLKLENDDVDQTNGTLGKNVVAIDDGLTIVGVKPDSLSSKRVTVSGDLFIDGNIKLKSGKKVWHEDNDGSGSSLDADTLDGNHWASVVAIQTDLQGQINNRLRKDQNDYTEFNIGVRSLQVSHDEDDSGDGILGPELFLNSTLSGNFSTVLRVKDNTVGFYKTDIDGTPVTVNGIGHPMTISMITGNVLFSGDITGFSDRRLKKNIAPVVNAVDLVMKINPVWFDWNENDKRDLGVIAQEVEEIFPSFVSEDETTGFKTVAYQKFIPLLLAAVKELANDR